MIKKNETLKFQKVSGTPPEVFIVVNHMSLATYSRLRNILSLNKKGVFKKFKKSTFSPVQLKCLPKLYIEVGDRLDVELCEPQPSSSVFNCTLLNKITADSRKIMRLLNDFLTKYQSVKSLFRCKNIKKGETLLGYVGKYSAYCRLLILKTSYPLNILGQLLDTGEEVKLTYQQLAKPPDFIMTCIPPLSFPCNIESLSEENFEPKQVRNFWQALKDQDHQFLGCNVLEVRENLIKMENFM